MGMHSEIGRNGPMSALETFQRKNESHLVKQKKSFILETFEREHFITVHKNYLWWISLSEGQKKP